ncbi:MAG: ankyrin repeat domain-containing protein [Betaproteobacteria bacterium]
MASVEDLIKAVRSGSLRAVKAALDAGAPLEDGQGAPGLPMGIACFMGHAEIVRELVARGASVNLPDNAAPVSPLAMAVRGNHPEMVRCMVELGAVVPEDMAVGLSTVELIAAQWLAYRAGRRATPPMDASGATQEVEEIVMPRAMGTDTMVLEADALRAGLEAEARRRAKN